MPMQQVANQQAAGQGQGPLPQMAGRQMAGQNPQERRDNLVSYSFCLVE